MIGYDFYEINKLYSIFKKYVFTKLENKIVNNISLKMKNKSLSDIKKQDIKNMRKLLDDMTIQNEITFEEIINMFKELLDLDDDIKDVNLKTSKYNNINFLSLPKDKEKLLILLVFCMFREEEIIKKEDMSDSFELILMFIIEKLSKIVSSKNSYILLSDNINNEVIAWYNENRYELKTNLEIFDNLNHYSIKSFKLSNDIEIMFLFENIDETYNTILCYAFKYIIEFFEKHFLRINLSNKIDNKNIYSRNLKIDYFDFIFNENITFNGDIDTDYINILHLSDLHLQINDDVDSSRDYAEKFLKKFYSTELKNVNSQKQYLNKKFADFIVITGDAINAGNSSKEILSNYICALSTIEIIAKCILGNIWKKRLIIIPGNHDYGMINDLKINIIDRSYSHAVTNNSSVNEFEKFAFFYLLFDNILLNNKLNLKSSVSTKELVFRVGSNDEKNIKFVCFNTASKANAIRSNKVRFDVINNKIKEGDSLILLMHHTPLFKINYYRDIMYDYYDYKDFIFGCNDEELELVLNISTKKEEITNRIKKYNTILKEKALSLSKPKEIEELIARNNRIISFLCEKPINDEVFCVERQKLISYFEASSEDQKDYDNNINLLKENYSKLLILGGHQHEQQYKIDEDMKIFEVARTFNNNGISYGLLEVKLDNYFDSIYYTPEDVKMKKL